MAFDGTIKGQNLEIRTRSACHGNNREEKRLSCSRYGEQFVSEDTTSEGDPLKSELTKRTDFIVAHELDGTVVKATSSI